MSRALVCSVVTNRPVSSIVQRIAVGAKGLGFDFWAGQIRTVSTTARHRCDVFSELRCPSAKTRRLEAPPLVTSS